MRTSTLIRRNLVWYWRTNLAVVGGIAVAVAVLAGALLVGESVRGSLRDLFLRRLGTTDHVVASTGFFRARLAQDLSRSDRAASPAIVLDGLVTHQQSRSRASGVEVYGLENPPGKLGPRETVVSRALATELGARVGDSVLVRVEKHSDVPQESLHGHKEDAARTIRLTVKAVVDPAREFSIRPQQGDVRAIYAPLARLQDDLEQQDRANTVLVSGAMAAADLDQHVTLDDLGVKVRVIRRSAIQVETASAVMSDALAEPARAAAARVKLDVTPVLTYLANTIRVGRSQTPYSLVTAIDLPEFSRADADPPPIVLNDWTARDLGARTGDRVSLEYYVWRQEGRIDTESAVFRVAGVVGMDGPGDRDLAPEYPGISGAENLDDWNPPFPMDLKRVRPKDEDYWDKYGTTPKAFVPLEVGQKLWATRFGKLTALRLKRPGVVGVGLEGAAGNYRRELRAMLDPLRTGFSLEPVRQQGLEASRGATDFGEYFTYFSFFLMASALLLAGLFFKLGVEQRQREIGLLGALGFPAPGIRWIFLVEGAALAATGALVGSVGAVGYASAILYGLKTWWVDAVGTTLLELHVSAVSIALGAGGGLAAAVAAIAWTMRGLERTAPRALLHGEAMAVVSTGHRPSRLIWLAASCAAAGVSLLAASAVGVIPETGGFFGAGALLLVAALATARIWIGKGAVRLREGRGVAQLGFLSAGYRPGRSTLSIALIAFASFLIVSVDAFRRDPDASSAGAGGFPLIAESLIPIYHDLNSESGREQANLRDVALDGVRFLPLRLKPGDDASCLNLYQPRNPRVIGASPRLVAGGRFAFQSSLATTAEERANPWSLLEKDFDDGAIPAAVDANSMTYVLHRKLGDEVVLQGNTKRPIRLRLVAALADSIFQRELIVSERNFVRQFPEEQGWRVFLIDAPAPRAGELATVLEEALSDYGFDAVSTAERLASFHRVENTYLATFQSLGALGLLLGTAGLAAVLMRNVLERRRELALLGAVGYSPMHLRRIVFAENALLLASGLVAGSVSAALAVAPALAARGGGVSVWSLAVVLGAVMVSGLAASRIAAWIAIRGSLLAALRSE